MPIKRICGFLMLLSMFFSCQSQTKNKPVTNQLTVSNTPLTDALKLAYIGNMGVLLEHKDKTVIIDGLHQYYNKQYVYPTEEIVNELISGNFKEFTTIEASLFTHVHGDHFSERYSLTFLKNRPNAIIVGSQQIHDSIAKLANDPDLMNSVKTVPYNRQPFKISHEGIDITAIQCNHSSPSRHGQIKNIAYVVTLNGYKILHIGDTDWDMTKAPFETLNIIDSDIDLAVIPYWMLLENNAYKSAMDLVSPKHIIATHIPPKFGDHDRNILQDRFPNITLLTTLGEVHYFKK